MPVHSVAALTVRAPGGRAVVVMHDETRPRNGHEAATLEALARRIAALLPAARHERPYFVPARTLTREEALSLGIHGADDLFGGVVPHAFVASKLISHSTPPHASARPRGWSDSMASAIAGVVLPGYAAFNHEDAYRAGVALLADGCVRFKQGGGIGGNGQSVLHDASELEHALDAIDPVEIEAQGVVLERNLESETTISIGEIHLGGLRAAYHGSQRRTLDHAGREVYGGSDLVVRRGRLADLEQHTRDPAIRLALQQVRTYDDAAHAAYPGLCASRRNYDVAQGIDASGRRWSGVLEQSWRIGGASPAELAALEALAANPDLDEVHASAIEVFALVDAPAGSTVHWRGFDPVVGALTKYSLVHFDGHPTR
jgi:hypothetical protein